MKKLLLAATVILAGFALSSATMAQTSSGTSAAAQANTNAAAQTAATAASFVNSATQLVNAQISHSSYDYGPSIIYVNGVFHSYVCSAGTVQAGISSGMHHRSI